MWIKSKDGTIYVNSKFVSVVSIKKFEKDGNYMVFASTGGTPVLLEEFDSEEKAIEFAENLKKVK